MGYTVVIIVEYKTHKNKGLSAALDNITHTQTSQPNVCRPS